MYGVSASKHLNTNLARDDTLNMKKKSSSLATRTKALRIFPVLSATFFLMSLLKLNPPPATHRFH